MSDQKDQGNVIRGHKATLNNPSLFFLTPPPSSLPYYEVTNTLCLQNADVSEEAKEHSREVLESL